MHEITLCQQALTLIEEQARLHHARKVTHVWLRVGAFSCVESSALQFCFGLVCPTLSPKTVNCTLKSSRPNAGAGRAATTCVC